MWTPKLSGDYAHFGRLGVVVPGRRFVAFSPTGSSLNARATTRFLVIKSHSRVSGVGRENAKKTELADFVFGCAGDWLGALVFWCFEGPRDWYVWTLAVR